MLDDRFYTSKGPLTLHDIIEGLEVKLPDPKFLDETITHPARLSGAPAGCLVFLDNKKHLAELDTCKATACFVSEALSSHVGARHIIPIISKTPRAHFARAMMRLAELQPLSSAGTSKISDSAQIHTSAVLGSNVVIGPRVVISPNVVIGNGVTIGAGSIIGANVVIEASLIGEGCTIKSGAIIGSAGFGVANDELGVLTIPHFGRVILGNSVHIGANSCVDRGQLGDTVIGDDVKIDNLVQIAHNVEIGSGSRFAALTGISGSCKIGKNVMLGGSVGLADHITIGDNVHVAARSGVMHNIPDGEYWGGTPAQPMRQYMRQIAVARKLGRQSKVKGTEDKNDA